MSDKVRKIEAGFIYLPKDAPAADMKGLPVQTARIFGIKRDIKPAARFFAIRQINQPGASDLWTVCAYEYNVGRLHRLATDLPRHDAVDALVDQLKEYKQIIGERARHAYPVGEDQSQRLSVARLSVGVQRLASRVMTLGRE